MKGDPDFRLYMDAARFMLINKQTTVRRTQICSISYTIRSLAITKSKTMTDILIVYTSLLATLKNSPKALVKEPHR